MTCLVSVVDVDVAIVAIVGVVGVVGVVAIVVDSLLSSELNMLTVHVLVVDRGLGGDLHGVLQDGDGGHWLGERRLHTSPRYRSRTGGPGVRVDVHRDGCGETLVLLRPGRPLKTVVSLTWTWTWTCPTSHYTSPPASPPPRPAIQTFLGRATAQCGGGRPPWQRLRGPRPTCRGWGLGPSNSDSPFYLPLSLPRCYMAQSGS